MVEVLARKISRHKCGYRKPPGGRRPGGVFYRFFWKVGRHTAVLLERRRKRTSQNGQGNNQRKALWERREGADAVLYTSTLKRLLLSTATMGRPFTIDTTASIVNASEQTTCGIPDKGRRISTLNSEQL